MSSGMFILWVDYIWSGPNMKEVYVVEICTHHIGHVAIVSQPATFTTTSPAT